jgi:hypothetical protein
MIGVDIRRAEEDKAEVEVAIGGVVDILPIVTLDLEGDLEVDNTSLRDIISRKRKEEVEQLKK